MITEMSQFKYTKLTGWCNVCLHFGWFRLRHLKHRILITEYDSPVHSAYAMACCTWCISFDSSSYIVCILPACHYMPSGDSIRVCELCPVDPDEDQFVEHWSSPSASNNEQCSGGMPTDRTFLPLSHAVSIQQQRAYADHSWTMATSISLIETSVSNLPWMNLACPCYAVVVVYNSWLWNFSYCFLCHTPSFHWINCVHRIIVGSNSHTAVVMPLHNYNETITFAVMCTTWHLFLWVFYPVVGTASVSFLWMFQWLWFW